MVDILQRLTPPPLPPRPYVRRAPGADDHGVAPSLIALAFLVATLWLYWMQAGH